MSTTTGPEDDLTAEERITRLYARYLQHPDRTVEHLIVRGQCLLDIKELTPGSFCAWRTAHNIGWSSSHNAMQVARAFGHMESLAPLQPLRLRELYDLARMPQDDPAVQLFLAALTQGAGVSEESVLAAVLDFLTEQGVAFACEVRTAGGDVDILTDELVIECKGLLTLQALREARRQLGDYLRALRETRRGVVIGVAYPLRDVSDLVVDIRARGIDVVILSGLLDERDRTRLEHVLGAGPAEAHDPGSD